MAKSISTHSKWKNIVNYINSIHDCMDGKTEAEQVQLQREMYAWLERNYQIGWNQKTLKQVRLEKLFIKTDLTDEPSHEEQN